jgi:RNA polymerase sigma-70 factor (ECF subfamily)
VAGKVAQAQIQSPRDGTRWSVVSRASAGSQEALEELGRLYWPVVYAFAERKGLSREDAEDVTQLVFARVLNTDKLGSLAPANGRFRSFLFACTQNEISHLRRHEAAGKRAAGLGLSFEALANEPWRGLLPVTASPTPEAFDRAWSTILVRRAFQRLAQDYYQARKMVIFETLKPIFYAPPDEGGFRVLGEKLGLSEGAARIAWFRFKHAFIDYLRREVMDTVSNPSEADDELRYLLKAWAGATA